MSAVSTVRDTDVSERINIREFLSTWDNEVFQQCAMEHSVVESRRYIAAKMDLTLDNVEELESVCSLNLLDDDPDKVSKWKLLEDIPEDLDLMSVRFRKQELEKRKDPKYYVNIHKKMKYRATDLATMYDAKLEEKKSKNAPVPEECQVMYPDVVLTIHLHRPIKVGREQHNIKLDKIEQMMPANIFEVLGRQKLTDLRDSVRCVHDLTVPGDLSENPDNMQANYAKDIFKGGFFFIENTFYNDTRENDAEDYSRVIMDWASKPGRNMGPYETRNMQDVTFLDLTVRLGQPYLYMHQGDCEHLVVFSSIRLLSREDPQNTREFPYLLRKFQRTRTLCRACQVQSARWITYGSHYAPEDPCFFCDGCFRALHYDTNKKKLGKFEAYKYFDSHAIV